MNERAIPFSAPMARAVPDISNSSLVTLAPNGWVDFTQPVQDCDDMAFQVDSVASIPDGDIVIEFATHCKVSKLYDSAFAYGNAKSESTGIDLLQRTADVAGRIAGSGNKVGDVFDVLVNIDVVENRDAVPVRICFLNQIAEADQNLGHGRFIKRALYILGVKDSRIEQTRTSPITILDIAVAEELPILSAFVFKLFSFFSRIHQVTVLVLFDKHLCICASSSEIVAC